MEENFKNLKDILTNIENQNKDIQKDVKKIQFIFSRFDSLVTKITELNKKVYDGMNYNDRQLIVAKKSIQEDIKSLKTSIFDRIQLMEDTPKIKLDTENKNTLIRNFGRY